MLAGAWLTSETWPVALILATVALVLMSLALMFTNLTVSDQGDYMVLRFGILGVFRKRIAYSDITAFAPAKSSLIDGWGIHMIPGRGWTWNLWGFQCVQLTVNGRTIRVGTDDVDGLIKFLTEKLR